MAAQRYIVIQGPDENLLKWAQSVSGADARATLNFIIVDAVGVCESDKTESRPLDRHPKYRAQIAEALQNAA